MIHQNIGIREDNRNEKTGCHRVQDNGGTFDLDKKEGAIAFRLETEQKELRSAGLPDAEADAEADEAEVLETEASTEAGESEGVAEAPAEVREASAEAVEDGVSAEVRDAGTNAHDRISAAQNAVRAAGVRVVECLRAGWKQLCTVKGQNAVLVVLMCAILVTACGSSIVSKQHTAAKVKAQIAREKAAARKAAEEAAKEPTIAFQKEKIKMRVGKTRVVAVKGEPADKTLPKLSYRSADEKVATVNEAGEITAVRQGETTITAVSPKGQEISLALTVKPPSMKKTIYLTYDDGPGSKVTPKLLKVLKKYNAKATFFVIGIYAKDNKKLLRKEIKEGHMVEIHTYSHDYEKIYKSSEAYLKDFDKTEKLILKTTGVQPTYWRFPGGSTNGYMTNKMKKKICKALHKRGYLEMDWTALSGDAEGIDYSKKEMVDRAIQTIKDAEVPVVLMHDSNAKSKTPEVTEAVLKYFTKRGYQFKSLDEYYGGELTLLP